VSGMENDEPTAQEIVEEIEEVCDKLESVLARGRVALDAVGVENAEDLVQLHAALKIDLAAAEVDQLVAATLAGVARYLSLVGNRLKERPLLEGGIDDAVAMMETFTPAMARLERATDDMKRVLQAADAATVRDLLRKREL
jgi:hypothetical protein